MPAPDRAHDLVLLGATGFTGALTAEHLARHAPKGLRWALAGRSRDKLATVRDRLAALDAECAGLPLLEADVTDPSSLQAIAQSARVVATTVGPYLRHGDPLVAACAEAGTDYADLTGEPEFVDRAYLRHHARAVETGARLVHACGFDSIPHDLGVQHLVEQLPEGVPIVARGFVRAGGRPSAGTLHSALTAVGRYRQANAAHAERRRAEGRPDGRRVRGLREPLRRERSLGAWALPLPTIDPQIVLRSAAALERYGPDFAYGHFAAVQRAPVAAAAVAGVGTAALLAQVGPARAWMMGRMQSGDGPDEAERAKGWFRVRFVGEAGGRRAVTEVSGGDPGYGDTAKMLAEAALCLAQDDLPETAGQVTTAVAMGPALRARLERHGIAFTVLEAA